MKIEQVFTEFDLSELEKVLAKSMEPKNSVMRLWQNWMRVLLKHTKAMRRLLLVCTILLCVDCTFLLFERYRWWALFCAIVGVFGLHVFLFGISG